MNNELYPEKRLDSSGKLVTRWLRPAHGSSQKTFTPPPPFAAPQSATTERERSLFEKAIDSLVSFLLGPEDKDSEADAQARDLLRQRLTELPHRTVRNLSDAWEKAKDWADKGLDSTEFGQFSERVRGQVNAFLAYQPNPEKKENVADLIDGYADRMRKAAEERAQQSYQSNARTETPSRLHFEPETQPAREPVYSQPVPEQHEPVVVSHPLDADGRSNGDWSPLDDFFEEVENDHQQDSYGTLDDLMDNGRTRRHH